MMRRSIVYLAGGFRTRWQDRVSLLDGFEFIDPSQHKLTDPKAYTAWDLNAISRADIVLAYLERGWPDETYWRKLKEKLKTL